MDRLDARNAALALYGMIVRPGATLCRISDEPGRYLVPSVAVLAVLIALSVLSPSDYIEYQMISATGGTAPYSPIVSFAISGLLLNAGIFWIGRRWGGNRSLRRAFPVLAYCLVPAMLGVLVGSMAENLYSLIVPETAVPQTAVSSDPYLPFRYGVMIQSVVGIFLVGIFIVGWILLLYIKAIRILNGFGYARSAAVLALAALIMYAGSLLVRGLITVALTGFLH